MIKNNKTTQKLAFAAILVAIAVIGGAFSIPVFSAKCAPIQHLVNVLSAIFLGPWYALAMAFTSSLLRVLIGTGSLLAFPGSMFGALLAGLLFKFFKNDVFAYIGELVGTGIIGAMCAFPMTIWFLGREAALFTYVIPFIISSLGGTLIAVIIYTSMKATKVIPKIGGVEK